MLSERSKRLVNDDALARLAAAEPVLPPGVRVGAPHSPQEQEADRAADTITAGGQLTGVARTSRRTRTGTGGGQPLPPQLRRKMETGYGADLSDVRVHTDDHAATLNDRLGSRAVTHGPDIHMGAKQYAPGSAAGAHLIAHEVAHVLQQRSAPMVMQRKMAFSGPLGKVSASAKLSGLFGNESTFSKITKMYERYKKTRTAQEEVQLLQSIIGLVGYWESRHGDAASKTEQERVTILNKLRTAAILELPKAITQADYMYSNTAGTESGDRRWEHVHAEGEGVTAQTAAGLGAQPKEQRKGRPRELDMADMAHQYELSDAELAAIHAYTGGAYDLMNAAEGNRMGSKVAPESATQARAEGLMHGHIAKEGLQKLPDFQGEVWRGMGLPKALFKKLFLDQDVFTLDQFYSTTTDQKQAAIINKKHNSTSEVAFVMKMKVLDGKNVEKLSQVASEKEILLAPGAPFAIRHRQQIADKAKKAELGAGEGQEVWVIDLFQTRRAPKPAVTYQASGVRPK